MIAQERQSNIIEHLIVARKAPVIELVEKFKVSEATIRRDLTDLEKQGRVIKTYGGAIISETAQLEVSYKDRLSQNADQKRRIGASAAALINPGESVFLDSGTTTTQAAENLRDKENLTVVTNSLVIASMLGHCSGIRLYVPGGTYRPTSMDLLGPIMIETLRKFAVDTAILSVDGFHPDYGLSASDHREAEAAKAAMSIAKRVIIVADSTKGERRAFASIGGFEHIGRIISDSDLRPSVCDNLRRLGVMVDLV
ncbi:MAG: DeoR/GlpR family DNA-binding transcription regulator [bacterium]